MYLIIYFVSLLPCYCLNLCSLFLLHLSACFSKYEVDKIKIIVAPQVRGHATPTHRELVNDRVYELSERCLAGK